MSLPVFAIIISLATLLLTVAKIVYGDAKLKGEFVEKFRQQDERNQRADAERTEVKKAAESLERALHQHLTTPDVHLTRDFREGIGRIERAVDATARGQERIIDTLTTLANELRRKA